MPSSLFGSILPLIPVLIVLASAVVVFLGSLLPRGGRVAAVSGRIGLGLALGALLRLVVSSGGSSGPLFADPVAPGPAGAGRFFPAVLGVARAGLLPELAALIVLGLGLVVLIQTPARATAVVGRLLAVAAALFCLLNPAPAALAVGWLALAFAPLLSLPEEDGAAENVVGWLALGAAGAAVFFIAAAALSNSGSPILGVQPAPRGVPALLILLAATAAGLGPFGAAVRALGAAATSRFVSVAALPLVGYLVAARSVIENPGGPTLLLRGLLILLALWGVAGALVGALAFPERAARILAGLAFLALAVAMGPVGLIGGALIGGSAVLGGFDERAAGVPLVRLPNPEEWLGDRSLTEVGEAALGDLAALLRGIEERYDLAVGLLLVLAAVFAFAR